MRWILAAGVLGAAFYGLWLWHRHILTSPARLPGRKSAVDVVSPGAMLGAATKEPAPPPAVPKAPEMIFSPQDIAKLREAAVSNNPDVRWTALELLYTLRDPGALGMVQKALTEDPVPEIRLKALRLLKDQEDVQTFSRLVAGLRDYDTTMRLAAARALGDLGHPAAVPHLTASLSDYEPDVRIEALRAMGKIEERRKTEFGELAAKLRRDYEQAVARAREAAAATR